jgi:hypothetical protein
MAHYVVTIDVKRVDDGTAVLPATRGGTTEVRRGPVVELGHIAIKNRDLAEVRRLAGAHLELVTDID